MLLFCDLFLKSSAFYELRLYHLLETLKIMTTSTYCVKIVIEQQMMFQISKVVDFFLYILANTKIFIEKKLLYNHENDVLIWKFVILVPPPNFFLCLNRTTKMI